MVAWKAYEVGTDVALFVHRRYNPDLAREADHVRVLQNCGIAIHRELPPLERRFLYDLVDENATNDEANGLLQQWKDQTKHHRGGAYWNALKEIEYTVLVQQQPPRSELLQVAQDAGWNVAALQEWALGHGDAEDRKEAAQNAERAFVNETRLHGLLFVVSLCVLVWGVVAVNGTDPPSLAYRANFLSTLLSPIGTLLRWQLAYWNGKIQGYEWLPAGTLMANTMGVIVGSFTTALSFDSIDPTVRLWEFAIKTGFAGSLSTMSTYVSETAALNKALPQHAWGYYYAIGTLILSCTLGVVSYVWAVV